MSRIICHIFNKSSLLFSNASYIRPSSRLFSDKVVQSNPKTEAADDVSYAQISRQFHKPSDFEKKILVWTGRFKRLEDVPQEVSVETWDRARNKARIKVANYMMVGTIIGCVIMIISGKRAAARGESVEKMNLAWHRDYNEKNKNN